MVGTVLLAATVALGSWGPRGCGPVGPSVRQVAPVVSGPRYEWRKIHGSKTQLLYDRGRLAGGWDEATNLFRWYEDGQWSEPVAKPWEKAQPARTDPPSTGDPLGYFEQASQQPVPNYGIDLDRLRAEAKPEYRLSGRPVSRQEAWEAIEAGTLTDDSARLRITVIGAESDRRSVLGDLASNPALAPWREKTLVRAYPPDHWAVASSGFVTGGRPTIYFQSTDGKVLHRQDDYEGGAEQLAQALRKADPSYKPEQDPDKRKPVPLVPDVAGIPGWALAGGGLLLVFLLTQPPE